MAESAAASGIVGVGDGMAGNLQSTEQAELIDTIDRLRRENIDASISVPNIVVCGDQSNGKSSLLESIVQVPFPANSNTCTVFPTEIILRNTAEPSIKISLRPADDRTQDERQHLRGFEWPCATLSREDFKSLYDAAGAFLSEFEPHRGFWYDRLRVEVTGPDQCHMSCIDLPGLFFQASRKYKQTVISAAGDYQTQQISNLISNSGNVKVRTLGVITKPDLTSGEDDVRSKMSLARNEELQLGLGWHVVKNIYHKHARSQAYRDSEEEKFFRSPIWSTLPVEDMGIANLRKKLSRSLFERTKADLPNFISEMDSHLTSTKLTLTQLGSARDTPKDQRVYLTTVVRKIQSLVHAALQGDHSVYDNERFTGDQEARDLRNTITRMSDQFAETMRTRGKLYAVEVCKVDDAAASGSRFTAPYEVDDEPVSGSRFTAPYGAAIESGQRSISFSTYCKDLTNWMQNTRGKDLRGLVNRDSIQTVFRQQSFLWKDLARNHIEECHQTALNFLRIAVEHAAGPHTGGNLMSTYVYPALEKKHTKLEDKVSELLWPHRKCHPITYNALWMGSLQAERPTSRQAPSSLNGDDANAENDSDDGYYSDGISLKWVTAAIDLDYKGDRLVAAQTMDLADVYYEISLSTFIDNITILAIERCLLDDLDCIVELETVAGLDDTALSAIASEPLEAREKRAKAEAQAAVLEAALRTCRRYASPTAGQRSAASSARARHTPVPRATSAKYTANSASPSPAPTLA